MYRFAAPSSPSPSTPRQSKVELQRLYREKEGECFNTLRDVINELTGEELQTRQEILRKAIDLLLTASEIRKQREGQVVHPTPGISVVKDTTSLHIAHPADLSWPHGWPSAAEFDAQSAYYDSQSHRQQHHLMFDPTFHQGSSQGYDNDWYNYR